VFVSRKGAKVQKKSPVVRGLEINDKKNEALLHLKQV